jgi:hypothetical protein
VMDERKKSYVSNKEHTAAIDMSKITTKAGSLTRAVATTFIEGFRRSAIAGTQGVQAGYPAQP